MTRFDHVTDEVLEKLLSYPCERLKRHDFMSDPEASLKDIVQCIDVLAEQIRRMKERAERKAMKEDAR